MRRLRIRIRTILGGSSKGFSLLELVIAMALMAIIAVAFLGGLSNAIMALHFADVQTTAESLARSYIEYEKSLPYDGEKAGYVHNPPTGYEKYTAAVSFEPLDDEGLLQQITVVVSHNNGEVVTLVGYKAAKG
jgi:prepilin-type N-terminal cleavage/methylation domain-containing protein